VTVDQYTDTISKKYAYLNRMPFHSTPTNLDSFHVFPSRLPHIELNRFSDNQKEFKKSFVLIIKR
jgi:hypothetical protein